jgi:hypothetical protein
MRPFHNWHLQYLIMALGLLAPAAALSSTPAFPARIYTIETSRSSKPILDALEKASESAGLQCLRSDSAITIQCYFNNSVDKPFRGVLEALDQPNENQIVIRVYTDTPYPQDGRIDPIFETALQQFFDLLSQNDVRHIEQCLGMTPQCSEVKFH